MTNLRHAIFWLRPISVFKLTSILNIYDASDNDDDDDGGVGSDDYDDKAHAFVLLASISRTTK